VSLIRAPHILCAGIGVLDEVFRVEQFPVGEFKTQASAHMSVSGGNAANAAVAIVRLGARASFVGPLGGPAGADPNGDKFLALMQAQGIDCSACPRMAGVPSSISAICIDPRGERAIVNHRDDRLIALRPADPGALVADADADAVVVDNRFPEFVELVCLAARDRGLPIVLDADEPRRESNVLLNLVSHVLFSAEGLRAMVGHDDLAAGLIEVRGMTPSFLAVSDGANGVLWLEGDAPRHTPAFPIHAVDTLGAGDTLHGAFALMLAEGHGEGDAMRFASAAAAIKCTRFGGITGVPSRAEVEAFLQERSPA
jgi:sulfofructose kinase